MSEKKRILIIDDEHTLLRLSQIIFQRKGFEVFVALSVKEGKNFLNNNPPVDVIVLDLMMPDENGFDFLNWKASDASEEIKNIKVVVNTAKNLTEDEKQFLGLYCEKIMHKGIDFTDRLVSEVQDIFN
jgi:DNA-binding response OmpR family regulator